MNDITDDDIVAAMIQFGSGFSLYLGRLYRFADAENQLRLKLAFPDFWLQYRELIEFKRDHPERP